MATTFNLANRLELKLLHEARNAGDDTADANVALPHADLAIHMAAMILLTAWSARQGYNAGVQKPASARAGNRFATALGVCQAGSPTCEKTANFGRSSSAKRPMPHYPTSAVQRCLRVVTREVQLRGAPQQRREGGDG